MNTALLLAAILLSGASPAATPEGCTCSFARETDGWCAVHGVGYVGLVEIRSQRLYEALDAHGHDLDLSTFECPACRRAIEEDGFCEEHRIGFVAGQAYFSALSYQLARGDKVRIADITCPTCRENARSRGWCERHQVGMVGHVAIRSKRDYERVATTLGILEKANVEAPRCEYCAVAMVFDGYCPVCKASYKDGKRVPAAP
jgi:rubrerythrin